LLVGAAVTVPCDNKRLTGNSANLTIVHQGVALLGLVDLLIVPPVIVAIIICAVRLHRFRHARIRAGITHGSGKHAETAVLWVLVPGLALIVLFHVALFSSPGPVSNLTPSQVPGTWIGAHGATLVVRADGTFTASRLPPNAGLPVPPSGHLVSTNPTTGRGTWQIDSGPFNGDPSSVDLTFTCPRPGSSCSEFWLQLEHKGNSLALYYYLGDPADRSNQYAFTRQ
jgi:hypothetical protein